MEFALDTRVARRVTLALAALVISGVLAGCADDSNNLTGGTTAGGTTSGGTTSGGTTSGGTTSGGTTSGGTTSGSTTGTDPCTTCGPTPVTPTGLSDCDPANPTAKFKPLTASTVSTVVGGICLTCSAASPVSAYDGNLLTYAVDSAQVGLAASVNLDGYGPKIFAVPTGKYRTGGFFVAYPTSSVADAALLATTQANLLDAGGAVIPLVAPSSNPPTSTIALTLLGLPIPGLTGASFAFVPVFSFQQPFNGLEQVFAPTVGALADLNVIEACVQK